MTTMITLHHQNELGCLRTYSTSSLPSKTDTDQLCMREEVVMAENAGWDHGFLRCGFAKDQPIVHQVGTELIHNTRA